MNESELIYQLLLKSTEQQAIDNQEAILLKHQNFTKDHFIGLSNKQLKLFLQNTSMFSVNSIEQLINSKYNEFRILGWSILFRDYSDDVLISFIDKHLNKSGNINIVYFVASMFSQHFLKKNNKNLLEKIGYQSLFNLKSIWHVLFSIKISHSLIKKNQFNYALDIIERCFIIKEPTVLKASAEVLLHIGSKNSQLLNYFLITYNEKIPPEILSIIKN